MQFFVITEEADISGITCFVLTSFAQGILLENDKRKMDS